VKRDTWVMLGEFSSKRIRGLQTDAIHRALRIEPENAGQLEITQLEKGKEIHPKSFESLEELLIDISVSDLGCAPENVRIILSGNDEFPYDAREQWTDSCNLLALQEGVVLGYDRNDRTIEAFREAGFAVMDVK